MLDVATGVKAEMALVKDSCRPTSRWASTSTTGVRRAVDQRSDASRSSIALLLVLVVIYLFLGNVRATLIPAVTIPVSIISAASSW